MLWVININIYDICPNWSADRPDIGRWVLYIMGLPRIACMFILHTGKETVLQKLLLGLMLYMVNYKKNFLQRNTSLKYECMRCYPPVNTVYLQLEGCRNTINCVNTKKSGDLILYNMHAFRTSPTLQYPPQQTMSKRHTRTCSMNVAFGKMWLLTLWSCHDDFLPIHRPCVGLAPDHFDQLWLTLQPPGIT